MKWPAVLPVLLLVVAPYLRAAEPALELTLPPRWYAVPGAPMSVYFDNIVLTRTPESYRFEVSCDLGRTEARRWTVTPAEKEVGDHALRIVVKDTQGRVLEQAQTVLRIVPRDAGDGRNLRLLLVGDSLTRGSLYPNELARLLSAPGNPQWTMLGTHRPTAARPDVAHEGYNGWTWAAFLARFEPPPPVPAAGPPPPKSISPFIFADAGGKGILDIPRYIRENCDGRPPDVVTFLLGTNDCFRANPDNRADMDKTIDSTLDNADKLLAAFRRAAPKTVLAVGLATPPNARDEAFESNYKGNFHRWGWKRIQHRLVQRMQQRLGGRESEGIHLMPTELNLDPIDGYAANNGAHPNATGYAQMGTSFYAWLKAWMSGRI